MYKYLIVILMLIPALAFGQVSRSGGGGGDGTTNADSIRGIVISTVIPTQGYVMKADTSGPDSIYWAPDLSGGASDTSLALANSGGGAQVVEWSADSIVVKDTATGIQALYILSHDSLTAVLNLLIVGNDTINSFDGSRLTVEAGSLYVDLTGGNAIDSVDIAENAIRTYHINNEAILPQKIKVAGGLDSLDFLIYNPGTGDPHFLSWSFDEAGIMRDDGDTVDASSTYNFNNSTIEAVGTLEADGLIANDSINVASGKFTIGGEQYDKLNGTGLTVSGGDLQTTLGVEIDTNEIDDAGFQQYISNHGGGSGEANTISSVGENASGADTITAGKSGVDLRIKSIIPGQNLVSVETDTTYQLDAADTVEYSDSTKRDFITGVNDDSGFTRESDFIPFKNGEDPNHYELIVNDSTDGSDDSLFFLPLVALFMGRYVDTTSAGAESTFVAYSDTAGHSLSIFMAVDTNSTSASFEDTLYKALRIAEGTNISIHVLNDSTISIEAAGGGTSDTSKYLADQGGGAQIVYWDNDSLVFADTATGTQNITLKSGETLIILLDSLQVADDAFLHDFRIIANNDTITYTEGDGYTAGDVLTITGSKTLEWQSDAGAGAADTAVVLATGSASTDLMYLKITLPQKFVFGNDSAGAQTVIITGDGTDLLQILGVDSLDASKYTDGSIGVEDIEQASANDDEYMKWKGSAWGPDSVDFSHLSGTATDAQIPNNITIVYSDSASKVDTAGVVWNNSAHADQADTSQLAQNANKDADGDTLDASNYLLEGGTNPLTADWAAGAFDITGLALLSADTITAVIEAIIRDLRLNVDGTLADYDSTDQATDGQQLTWNDGNTLTWEDPGSGSSPWATSNDTTYRTDGDNDTTMIIYDDDAGYTVWKAVNQTLGIYVDTIFINGQTVSGFYDTEDLIDAVRAFLLDSLGITYQFSDTSLVFLAAETPADTVLIILPDDDTTRFTTKSTREIFEFMAKIVADSFEVSTDILIRDFRLITNTNDTSLYDATDNPSDGDQLTWNSATKKIDWQVAGGGAGEANTASNKGTAADSIFFAKNGVDLEFRRLIEGLGVDISASEDTALIVAVDSIPVSVVLKDSTLTANGDSLAVATVPDGVISFGKIDYSTTVAGNPALGSQESWFGDGEGVIFEGVTANDNEGRLVADDPGSDITWILPNTGGTISLVSQVVMRNGTNELTADWDVGAYDVTMDMLVSDSVNIGGTQIKDFAGGGLSIISASKTLAVNVSDSGAVEILEDSLQVKLDGSTLDKSTSGLKISDSPTITGTVTADGFTMGQDENLTINSQTLTHNGTDFVFNDEVNGVNDDYNATNWNGDAGFATKDDIRDEMELKGDIAGETWTGTHDYGGASLEIPNGATDIGVNAVGEIAHDTNDDNLRLYSSTYSDSVSINSIYHFEAEIIKPDLVQDTTDYVTVLVAKSHWAPFGIKVLDLGIETDTSSTYSVSFQNWTHPCIDSGTESVIEVVATSSTCQAEDDGTLTNADIAANSRIVIDLPTSNVRKLTVWGTYYIKSGD